MPDKITFDERSVGISFNPGNHTQVDSIKRMRVDFRDFCNDTRNKHPDNELKRMVSIAITEIQTAQMWADKAVTWDK